MGLGLQEASGIVKVTGKVIGVSQIQPIDIYHRQVLNKAHLILRNSYHPLHKEFQLLHLGRRFRVPCGRTKRFKGIFCLFVSVATGLMNSS